MKLPNCWSIQIGSGDSLAMLGGMENKEKSMKNTSQVLIRAVSVAAMLAGAAVISVVPTPWDAAYAGNGKSGEKGNGGNKGNRGNSGNKGNSGAQSSKGGNGNGAIASELKGLNAAHANPQALANAAPNSMPGKLYSFQQAYQAIAAAQANADEAQALYDALAAMDEKAVFAAYYPDAEYDEDGNPILRDGEGNPLTGDAYDEAYAAALAPADEEYNAALAAAGVTLGEMQDALAQAEGDSEAAYLLLTDGRELSPEAYAALMAMLGIELPAEEPVTQ